MIITTITAEDTIYFTINEQKKKRRRRRSRKRTEQDEETRGR